MMSTRSGRVRPSMVETSPPRTRKGTSPTRSPARSRKTSPPARSPSRKSPARKSPSRKTTSKFPARKSPSRTTKEEIQVTQKSPAKRSTLPGVEVKLDDVSAKVEMYRSVRTRRSEYTIKDYGSESSAFSLGDKLNGFESAFAKEFGLRNRKPVEEVIPRRSSRLRESSANGPDIRRSLSKSASKSVSKSVSQSIDTYSDGEASELEFQKEKSKSVTRRLATPLRDSVSKIVHSKWEFGGRIGSVVLMLLVPLTAFSILVSCTKVCSVKPLYDLSSLKNLTAWFNPKATLLLLSQVVLQAAIALLPVCGPMAGRMDDSNTQRCFNAFFSSILTLSALFLLDYLQIFSSDIILKEYLGLATASYIFAVILSVILFVKSRKVDSHDLNPYGNTGYTLYDFWMGREIHPFIKKLDVKIWISRISNISALVLAVLIFKRGFNLHVKLNENLTIENYQEVWQRLRLQPTIILFSMMQIIYLLNFIMREYRVTTTFFWQSEGVGYYQLVASAFYPFYFTTISKFVADSNLTLSNNFLISAATLYVIGFLVMLISNGIKYEFRKNPLQPSVTHLDSMPTFHGKKLLISNTWGLLRHPNYLGDILIHISLALPGIVTRNYIAAAPALLTVLMLLHRAWRDHARCNRRYGSAWQRYCKRVPSVFLPKIL